MWRTVKKSTVNAGTSFLVTGLGTFAVLALLLFSDPVGRPFVGSPEQLMIAAFSLVAAVGIAARATLSPKRPDKDAVVILGNSRIAGELRRDLSGGESSGRRFDPSVVDPATANESAATLRELITNHSVSEVVVTDSSIGAHADVTSLLIECKFRGLKISRAPEFYEGLHQKVWLEALRPEAFVYSDAINLSRPYVVLKRLLDLTFAFMVFVLTLPLMLMIALAVKLDSHGPVLFRQERLGRFGTPFMLYKFRSMRSDAEKETGPVWAQENDDRVTRVGRILRRTHLDELPQILNVLKDDLSFVGPRPERECFVKSLEKQIPYFRLREYVKPGITGWAQVRAAYGDSVMASAEKLRFDLYYAKHASTGFDIKILLLTVWHVAFGRGR